MKCDKSAAVWEEEPPAVCQPLLLFTREETLSHWSLYNVQCCMVPKHLLLFRRGTLDYLWLAAGDIGQPPSRRPAAFAYLTLQGPTRGIGPWTLDFNASLRCRNLVALLWTSHLGIPFSFHGRNHSNS